MCKESQARCCQSTPKLGPFSLPTAHKSGSHLQRDSLLFRAWFFFAFLLSDFLVIAFFFLTLTAESPDFCIWLLFWLEELYRSSCQLLKCMLIRNGLNCHSICFTFIFFSRMSSNLFFYRPKVTSCLFSTAKYILSDCSSQPHVSIHLEDPLCTVNTETTSTVLHTSAGKKKNPQTQLLISKRNKNTWALAP